MLVAKDVAARGARIRFVEAGKGPPLVLLHDCAASQATLAAAATSLSTSFRVVVPNLPGFGASEKPDPLRYAYGYDAFAESVFDLVAALGLGRAHVCGHGMGAGVALSLAAAHPALVHKLVLVDALVYPTTESSFVRAGRVPLLGGLLFRQAMGHALFRAYLQATVYAGARKIPPGRIDDLYEHFNVPAARQAAHATVVAKADTRPLVARLPRISAETLVVWGRDDRLATVEHGRRLARELRARFEVIECGRCPPDEEPEAFASIVSSFLARSATPEPPRRSAKSGGKGDGRASRAR